LVRAQRGEVEAARARARLVGFEEEVGEAKGEVQEAEERSIKARREIWRRVADGEELLEGGEGYEATGGSEAPPDYVP
jgi:hypothetical protein